MTKPRMALALALALTAIALASLAAAPVAAQVNAPPTVAGLLWL